MAGAIGIKPGEPLPLGLSEPRARPTSSACSPVRTR
jgi:hypothetical protein